MFLFHLNFQIKLPIVFLYSLFSLWVSIVMHPFPFLIYFYLVFWVSHNTLDRGLSVIVVFQTKRQFLIFLQSLILLSSCLCSDADDSRCHMQCCREKWPGEGKCVSEFCFLPRVSWLAKGWSLGHVGIRMGQVARAMRVAVWGVNGHHYKTLPGTAFSCLRKTLVL